MATRCAPWQSFRIPVLAFLLAFMMPPLAAASAGFHATLDAGVGWPLHDDAPGFAQFHGGVGVAVNPNVVVSLDVRRYDLDLGGGNKRSILAVGPGARRTVGEGTIRPFVQANMFLVSNRDSDDGYELFHQSTSGVALGLLVGGDIALNRTLSAPVGASVVLGQLGDVGLFAGISFHPPARETESAPANHESASQFKVLAGIGGSTTEATGLGFESLGFTGQGHAGLLWSASSTSACPSPDATIDRTIRDPSIPTSIRVAASSNRRQRCSAPASAHASGRGRMSP